jgi:hypothetical protein
MPSWPWLRTWVPALPLAVLLLLACEAYWRHQGFVPRVSSDMDLWCLARDAARAADEKTIVLIGESRMRRGIVPGVLARRFPGTRVLQLALDGSSPVPVLTDLANDPRFRAVVLCTLTPSFLVPEPPNQGAFPFLDYYRHDWNLSKRIDRHIRTAVQSAFAIAQEDLSWRLVIRQVLDGKRPEPPALREYADRFGAFDFEDPRVNPDALQGARQFALNWIPQRERSTRDAVTHDQWLACLEPVEDAVRRIQARGGRVVFLRPVSNGPIRAIEDECFPRARYWDVFARRTSAVAIHFEDVPAMRQFVCPEWLHLSFPDTFRFTEALADELLRRGILPAAGREEHHE